MINKQRNTTVPKESAPGARYTHVELGGFTMLQLGEYLHSGTWMNN